MFGEFRVIFFSRYFQVVVYVASLPLQKNMVPKPVFQDGLKHSNQLY